MKFLKQIYTSYTPRERRHLLYYIAGLMIYKLGLEIFQGGIITIAMSKFETTSSSFEDSLEDVIEGGVAGKLGILQSLNLAFQVLGTSVAVPLVRRFRVVSVLMGAVVVWGVVMVGFVGMDLGLGGRPRGEGEDVYGRWEENWLFPVNCVAGVCYGIVELVRKVIPREILEDDREGNEERSSPRVKPLSATTSLVSTLHQGGKKNFEPSLRPLSMPLSPEEALATAGTKLRRLDAIVHIFYELAGTGGAFLSAELMIKIGSNMAVCVSIGVFGFACCIWWWGLKWVGATCPGNVKEGRVGGQGEEIEDSPTENRRWFLRLPIFVYHAPKILLTTLSTGFNLILSTPRHAWLPLGYSVSLYSHRYLENALAPLIAKYILHEPAYYQIIVGGSNLGELLGALVVFITSDLAWVRRSPLAWVRMDALCLLGVWGIALWRPQLPLKRIENGASESTRGARLRGAWLLAMMFLPISFGWAAGDVSLNAYIQANLGTETETGESSEAIRMKKLSNANHQSQEPIPSAARPSPPQSVSMPQDSSSPPSTPIPTPISKRRLANRPSSRSSTQLSSLASVMAVLYTLYIIIYAILNPSLGHLVDRLLQQARLGRGLGADEAGGESEGREIGEAVIHHSLLYIGGVQYTIISATVFACTFLPALGREWPWKRGRDRER